MLERLCSLSRFGGAFTDAAGININHLSAEAQERLIRAYYSEQGGVILIDIASKWYISGSEYGLGRVNIGGCDFSDRPYTYCDTEVKTLNHDDQTQT